MIRGIGGATPSTYSQTLNRQDGGAALLSRAMESRAPSGPFLEGAAVTAKPGAQARAKQPSVQILVVVANIQMRTLKAEEGKGSM
ncbi:hypothetical protein GBA52_025976 [Prunus armeniaca]|nr:hypothetical protein GBA52_025976 [Prunus armeniaca]